ncbi:LysR substrate-binding domain-containing protein [Porticoccus sp. GXU_MW_L64]
MSINFYQIRSFWAVANNMGFIAGADALNISQPTLTRQIKELEEGYGIRLIERHAGRKITLTREGEEFFKIATEVMDSLEHAERYLKRYSRTEISVSAVMTDVLPAFLGAVNSVSDSLNTNISMGTSSEVLDKLLARKCDFGILTLSADHPDLDAIEVGRYPILALFHDEHPLAGKDEISIFDLVDEDIIIGTKGGQTRQQFDISAMECGVEFNIAQEVNSLEMIGQFVRIGLGVGIIGYNGITEKNMEHVSLVKECKDVLPVHLACRKEDRTVRLIDVLFRYADSHLSDRTPPFKMSKL